MQWIISVVVPLLTAIALRFDLTLVPDPATSAAIVPIVTVLVWILSKFKIGMTSFAKAFLAMIAGIVWALVQGVGPLQVMLLQGAANGLLASGFWSVAKSAYESVGKSKPPSVSTPEG